MAHQIPVTCQWCARGYKPEQRADTKEWVHTIREGGRVIHTLCIDKMAKSANDINDEKREA